jgi:hypothetical protein
VFTEDEVQPATLVARMLQPTWRHALYQALDSADDTLALRNALGRAAAGADASPAQLRQVVETVLAEGQEEVAEGFVHNPRIPEDHLLDLCDRGVLTTALGHRPGPRSLLARMCEVHRYPESILTLGLALYGDPAVPPADFAAFLSRYGDVSGGWLLRTLSEADPDLPLKQSAYEDALAASPSARGDGWQAVGFHARHLANSPGSDADRLARFLDRHTDGRVLAFLLDSRLDDPACSDLVESRARDRADLPVADALRRRGQRRDAAGPSLTPEAAALLAATGDPDVLLLLAANPRTPHAVLRELSLRRASPGARAIRNAAARTLDLARKAGGRPEA